MTLPFYYYDYFVSQMSSKANEYQNFNDSDVSKSAELSHINPKHLKTHKKSPYVGLTLMQYFKMNHSNEGLQEIDEESNSSISASTPYFADSNEQKVLINGSKMGRRDKNRTEGQQQLLPLIKQAYDHAITKITTITLNQTKTFDKSIIKLPSIHDQRHINNSRTGIVKDGKVSTKKQVQKIRYQGNNSQQNTAALNKQNEKLRIHQLQRNVLLLKKSIRARVTSTSFYQPHTKERGERERIKTQQQSLDKTLEKPFIVTKYEGLSGGSKKSKEEIHLKTLKKNQNTVKLIKNNV